jgi:hypothetical protein
MVNEEVIFRRLIKLKEFLSIHISEELFLFAADNLRRTPR